MEATLEPGEASNTVAAHHRNAVVVLLFDTIPLVVVEDRGARGNGAD